MARKKAGNSALALVRKSKLNKVKLAVTDIDGILRGKIIHKEKFNSAAKGGFGFCNVVFGWDSHDVCYDNAQYTGWHTGYPDAQAQIDASTYREVPWADRIPFFLADFVDAQGGPLAVCPRQLLKTVVARAEKMNIRPLFAFEYEFFNFLETPQSLADKSFTDLKPLTPGMFGYSLLRSTLNQDYFNALIDDLTKFKVPIEGIHTETGPGVYEAAIQYGPAVEAADRAVLFKTASKEIAYRFGIMPTFMAKWHPTLPGCSGHIHQSLWKSGKNVFYAGNSKTKMSALFESYLAGQMELLPDVLPMFAPNINSYKRLVEGLWAPTKVTWGIENRTSAFRVIPGGEKSTRLETRVGGADVNPYLAIAAALATGLYGIQKKLKLKSKPIKGNAYAEKNAKSLPKNLWEATAKFEKSKIARQLFGNEFVDHFVATRKWEWRQFQQAVTDWELKRYLEII